MSEGDEKLQKHLIDEMMKVSKTNPDVMIYMGILMKNYEKLEEEIKRLKEDYMILQNASDKVEEEKDREIERLNNIINEIEKLCIDNLIYDELGMKVLDQPFILDKINELKGSVKE